MIKLNKILIGCGPSQIRPALVKEAKRAKKRLIAIAKKCDDYREKDGKHNFTILNNDHDLMTEAVLLTGKLKFIISFANIKKEELE